MTDSNLMKKIVNVVMVECQQLIDNRDKKRNSDTWLPQLFTHSYIVYIYIYIYIYIYPTIK